MPTPTKLRGDQINSSGWHPLNATLLSSTIDGATGVMYANADVTPVLQKGMRLSYQQLQSLTAYWNLDANSNSQVGSFNGTDTAISYVAGKFGNCASFNGTTSKIVIADNATLKPTGDFTIGAWFKTSATGVTQMIFQSFSQNTLMAGFFIRVSDTNKIQILIGKNTGSTIDVDYTYITGKTTVTDGNWHYAVMTFRNNYMQIYLDGSLEVSAWSYSPAYSGTNYVRIGTQNTAGPDNLFFNGQIDDVYLINGYALDEQTIKTLYISGLPIGTIPLMITKYSIVTTDPVANGNSTLITSWGGTDFSLVSGTIYNPKISGMKSPYGFNINPDKWTVLLSDVVGQTQSSPVTGTWYNLGSLSITIPIGLWNVQYTLVPRPAKTSGTIIQQISSLSTSNSSPSDSDFLTNITMQTSTGNIFSYSTTTSIPKCILLTAKTVYYLIAEASLAADSIAFRGDVGPTKVKAINAYL